MNFDEAISAHASWKMKLTQYIRKPDRSLNPNEVCKDNACELGKWIYSSVGEKYTSLPEFTDLKNSHKEFHKLAADIIKRADNGEQVAEEVALGGSSNYSKFSGEVVRLLMLLKQKVKN